MTRLLLTRPSEDSRQFSELLIEQGFDVVTEPLLEIIPFPVEAIDISGVQALLATSANGMRAAAAHAFPRTLPVYAVGESTGQEAQRLGFSTVFWAGGDVVSLGELVRRSLDPCRGKLVHVAGTHVAGDLAGDLGKAGFDVRREVLYEARPVQRLGSETIEALQGNKYPAIDGVLFFSPRTGATFAKLIDTHGLVGCIRNLTAFCLSAAVARQIEELPWREILIAKRPERSALLEILTKTAPVGRA